MSDELDDLISNLRSMSRKDDPAFNKQDSQEFDISSSPGSACLQEDIRGSIEHTNTKVALGNLEKEAVFDNRPNSSIDESVFDNQSSQESKKQKRFQYTPRLPLGTQLLSPSPKISEPSFKRLAASRNQHFICNRISEIKNIAAYKVDIIAGLISRISQFSNEVLTVELVDEGGVIEGDMEVHLEKIFKFKPQSVLILKGCSIWKIGAPRLNIVQDNILEVIE